MVANHIEHLVTLSGAAVALLNPNGFFLDHVPHGHDIAGDINGQTSSPRIVLSDIGPGEGESTR